MKQNKPQMLILACPCQYNPGVNPVKVKMNEAVMEDSQLDKEYKQVTLDGVK